MSLRWDIFCKVIDNYGDIGVSWRLARQLAAEHDLDVRLWLDDVTAFCRIYPEGDPMLSVQRHCGVAIHHWSSHWRATDAADVVIEAFACELPTQYIAAMAARERVPLWLNLEYLSAEGWVEGCHGLPSLQGNNLKKYFFFPGFSPQTGGLLRESGLILRRQEFQGNAQARTDFLLRIGVEAHEDCRLISLFCYENSALPTWLDGLVAEGASHILVPEGRIIPALTSYIGEEVLQAGRIYRLGALTIQVLPFLSQDDYDLLLWACDFNIVRGEDSFVRAQWAGRPFIWHIYPQEEDAHLIKLDAFLARYCEGLSEESGAELSACWRAWNQCENSPIDWPRIIGARPELAGHAEHWCGQQSALENLAYSLVQFHQNWL